MTAQFEKYFTGNETDVPVNEDFQKLAAEVHKDYQENKEITSVALTLVCKQNLLVIPD